MAQRARVTIIAMAISSVCCVLAALALHRPMILIPLSLVWGIAVIADSAQFSTIISEVSDKNYVGTALTCQVALGFLLTAAVIRLMAAIAARYGWQWALASMALGPALGIVAMMGLLPAAPHWRVSLRRFLRVRMIFFPVPKHRQICIPGNGVISSHEPKDCSAIRASAWIACSHSAVTPDDSGPACAAAAHRR